MNILITQFVTIKIRALETVHKRPENKKTFETGNKRKNRDDIDYSIMKISKNAW